MSARDGRNARGERPLHRGARSGIPRGGARLTGAIAPIRAVLLDLDNTLILEDEATLRAVRAAASIAEGRGIDAVALAAAVAEIADARWRAGPAYRYGEAFGVWWGEALWGGFTGESEAARALAAFVPHFRVAVWRDALARVGVRDDALADELARAYVRVRRSAELIDPEADSVLADLARDRILVLVTNGAGDVQREKLRRTPFADRFAAIVISMEVGVGKPDPGIYRYALECAGIDAAAGAVVGDSLARDIAGARAAGLRAIWLDRGLWRETGPDPDASIRRLSELRAALDALERRPASARATP